MSIKFQMKRVVAVAAVLSACAGAQAAVPVNLGPVVPLIPTTFQDYVGVGVFSNSYIFTLPNNAGSGYDIRNAPVNIAPIPVILPTGGNLNLAFSSVNLYYTGADNAIGGAGANADVWLAGFLNALPTVTAYNVNIGPNGGGTFYLDIVGKADGSLGGSYSGSISVLAAPVPEPESYAMLLAGLGVMGAIAVRRNKSKKQD